MKGGPAVAAGTATARDEANIAGDVCKGERASNGVDGVVTLDVPIYHHLTGSHLPRTITRSKSRCFAICETSKSAQNGWAQKWGDKKAGNATGSIM